MTSTKNLHHALKQLDTLPPIPSIARKILSLKITTDEGEQELLKLIEQDPAILSKIVGLANSPLFGTNRKILSLRDATILLGSKRVKMVALSFAMLSSMTRKQSGLLNVQGLWQHSLSVAMTMDTLVRLMPDDRRPADEEIYLAGLFHDIGFLVLDYLDPVLSDRFHARLSSGPDRSVEEVEAEMLEMNHSELGALLGRHWNLPESIVTVLKYHHAPNDARAAAGQPLTTLVNLAEKLLPTFGIAEPVLMDIAEQEWQSLGIDLLKVDEIKARVQEHVKKVASMNS
ncbi:MAG: HDOD domain-containing protein [Gallionella sp.]|nr:HDOD domain-containing protein [Gallionella sp.]